MSAALVNPSPVTPSCELCGAAARPLTEWAWRCEGCGVRFSSLEPEIEAGTAVLPDEDSRAAGLRSVREKSHAIVLDAIAGRRPLDGLALLDVGCGHGWFLEAAAARGMAARGVEPDRAVAERTRAKGLVVDVGFFPQDVPAEQRFDVVAFNDVFEHLPDPAGVLCAVHDRLRPGGLLAISIPTADGLGYRTAAALARAGIRSPLDRLWQRGLPSPHLWYFTQASLVTLAGANGFRPLAGGRLPSVERKGLRQRIAADPRSGPVQYAALVAISVATPVLNHQRFSDAMWLLLARTDDD